MPTEKHKHRWKTYFTSFFPDWIAFKGFIQCQYFFPSHIMWSKWINKALRDNWSYFCSLVENYYSLILNQLIDKMNEPPVYYEVITQRAFISGDVTTVHSHCITAPFTFFNFVMLQPDTAIVWIHSFSIKYHLVFINLHAVPQKTKWNQNFRNVCRRKKRFITLA